MGMLVCSYAHSSQFFFECEARLQRKEFRQLSTPGRLPMQAKDDEIAELARTVAGLQSALDDERGSPTAARRRRVGALPLPGRTTSARCRATRRNFLIAS